MLRHPMTQKTGFMITCLIKFTNCFQYVNIFVAISFLYNMKMSKYNVSDMYTWIFERAMVA